MANGLVSREIAARLGTSPSTVETQVRSGMAKLGARTRLEAAVLPTGRSAPARRLAAPAANPLPSSARLPLDEEQCRLLAMLADGASLAEVAGELSWSRRTIGRRLAAARLTLGVPTTAQAVALARRAAPPA